MEPLERFRVVRRRWRDLLGTRRLLWAGFIGIALDMHRTGFRKDALRDTLPVAMLGEGHNHAASLGNLLGVLMGQILGDIEPGHRPNPAAHGRSGCRSADDRADPAGGDDRPDTGHRQRPKANQRTEDPAADPTDRDASPSASSRAIRFGLGRNHIRGAGALRNQRNLLNRESGIVKRVNCLFGQPIIVEHPDDRMVATAICLVDEPTFSAGVNRFSHECPPRSVNAALSREAASEFAFLITPDVCTGLRLCSCLNGAGAPFSLCSGVLVPD